MAVETEGVRGNCRKALERTQVVPTLLGQKIKRFRGTAQDSGGEHKRDPMEMVLRGNGGRDRGEQGWE